MNQKQLKEIVKDQTLEIDLIADSGHAWLKIPKSLAFDLDYSMFSFQDAKNLYLEEDRDLELFIQELEKHDIKYSYNEIIYNNECFVRDLMRYEKQ
jgi:hypothetical protein